MVAVITKILAYGLEVLSNFWIYKIPHEQIIREVNLPRSDFPSFAQKQKCLCHKHSFLKNQARVLLRFLLLDGELMSDVIDEGIIVADVMSDRPIIHQLCPVDS